MVKRLVVLISGNGSNLQSLIDHCAGGELHGVAEIRQVISNRKDAFGLERARRAQIETRVHSLWKYKKEYGETAGRELYDSELAELIIAMAPDLVVCAGWMHILSARTLDPLEKAGIGLVNLHPALPGQFDGANAIERAYESFQKAEITETGVMIHWVVQQVDRGQPILVERVPIQAHDTLQDLEQRIHSVEHLAIVHGTKKALED